MRLFRQSTSESMLVAVDLTQTLTSTDKTRRMKFTFSIAVFALALTGCTKNSSTELQFDEAPTEKIVSVAPNCESALRGFSLHESKDNPGSVAWYVFASEAALEACRSYDWIAWVDANRSVHSEIEDYVYYSDTAPILSDGDPERFLELQCDNYLESNGTPALACS